MNPAHVDLVSLRVFVGVAQSGSISAGADQVHLTAGAVSKRIAELEAETGVPLFARLPTGVELTVAGHALLHWALQVLLTVERLAADMDSFAQGLNGQVRVLATSSAILQGLPDRLAAFGSLYPSVGVQLEERLSSEIVRMVLERRGDLAIFTGNVPHDGLSAQGCGEDQMVLVVPHRHALAAADEIDFQDALPYAFVSQFESTSFNNVLAQAAAAHGEPLRLHSLMRSYDGVCRMVAAGHGLGVIPDCFGLPTGLAPALRIVRLRDAWAKRRLLVGVRDAEGTPAAAKALRKYQLEHPMAPG